MSSLSSSSTDTEVWNSYDDNASYEEDSDTAKAAAFITACRILLQRRPKRAGWQQGAEQEFDPSVYEQQMQDARDWKANQSEVTQGGPGAVLADFRNFRD